MENVLEHNMIQLHLVELGNVRIENIQQKMNAHHIKMDVLQMELHVYHYYYLVYHIHLIVIK